MTKKQEKNKKTMEDGFKISLNKKKINLIGSR